MSAFDSVVGELRHRLEFFRGRLRAFGEVAGANVVAAIVEHGEEAMVAQHTVEELQKIVDAAERYREQPGKSDLLRRKLDEQVEWIDERLLGKGRDADGPWLRRSSNALANFHAIVELNAQIRLRALYVAMMKRLKTEDPS